MKKSLLVGLLVLFGTTIAFAQGKVRWHFNPDGSVLLDSNNFTASDLVKYARRFESRTR
jgi:hypothetical protein